jgi:hypothetical protein
MTLSASLDVPTVLVIVSLFLFCSLAQPKKNPYGSESPANSPYLRPWLPYIGSIGYALTPQAWMERMHERMGDVFTTKLFGYYVTFVRGQKNIVQWANATNKELSVSPFHTTPDFTY